MNAGVPSGATPAPTPSGIALLVDETFTIGLQVAPVASDDAESTPSSDDSDPVSPAKKTRRPLPSTTPTGLPTDATGPAAVTVLPTAPAGEMGVWRTTSWFAARRARQNTWSTPSGVRTRPTSSVLRPSVASVTCVHSRSPPPTAWSRRSTWSTSRRRPPPTRQRATRTDTSRRARIALGTAAVFQTTAAGDGDSGTPGTRSRRAARVAGALVGRDPSPSVLLDPARPSGRRAPRPLRRGSRAPTESSPRSASSRAPTCRGPAGSWCS